MGRHITWWDRQIPSDDIMQIPSDDVRQIPSDDIRQIPSDDIRQIPCVDVRQIPSDDIRQIPSDDVSCRPTTLPTLQQQPCDHLDIIATTTKTTDDSVVINSAFKDFVEGELLKPIISQVSPFVLEVALPPPKLRHLESVCSQSASNKRSGGYKITTKRPLTPPPRTPDRITLYLFLGLLIFVGLFVLLVFVN